jgi:L-2-hydroxyglutarate oxidase LhgO
VIGLAAAATLSSRGTTVLVEAHESFGRETSSRNSEVVHSGIHYPPDSLKTRLCIEGQKQLYGFARRYSVPHRICGKLVIAQNEAEAARLDSIAAHAKQVGARFEDWGTQLLARHEPAVSALRALHFSETGIIDSHRFMSALESKIASETGLVAYRHRVEAVQALGNRWAVRVASPQGPLEIESSIVVNATGLGAARLSNEALGGNRYEHRFCRGRYFNLSAKWRNHYKRLVYPLPQQHGLGVHTTLDMEGFLRLGPDVDWCADSEISNLGNHYACDWETLRPEFAQAARRLIPALTLEDLTPGTIGIRPKLFQDGKATPDFLVENHRGWIHCLGIESPGLTASLAIAERVEKLAYAS